MNDIFLKCKNDKRLSFLIENDLYPFFHELESRQDAVVTMNNQRIIMLGSNNYLSLTNNEDVINASLLATKKFGTGVSGSRFLNGTTQLHNKLEKELANFLNKESCVIFSSGFNANLGILSCIGTRSDVILCDRENHASIYDGIRLGYAKLERYYHNDMQDLENRLIKLQNESGGVLIVTDGVFSMSGEIANLPKIIELANKYKARVMIDDAHGFGILGTNGKGTAEYFNLENEVDIIMGTFSKSLASLGGYIAGQKDVIDYIKHTSRPFIFSAALPPANLAAATAALNIIKEDKLRIEKLKQLSNYLRFKLQNLNIKFGGNKDVPIIPIYTKSELRTLIICKLLFQNGVYVNPVLPPASPEGNCLIRLSLQANHTFELIDEAINVIDKIFKLIPEQETIAFKKYQELKNSSK